MKRIQKIKAQVRKECAVDDAVGVEIIVPPFDLR